MTTPLIAQRLQQQTQAWNLKQGANLTVQQYVSRMSMLTPATRQKLINIYYEATKSTVSPATQDIIQTRLAEQAAAWNKEHGTNYSIQEYLDMLSKGDGVTITPKTKEILTKIVETPSITPPAVLTPEVKEKEPEPIKITDRSWITLPASSGELKKIVDAKAGGLCVGAMRAYYTVKTYAITLKSGGQIYVEALSNKDAKQKAIDAGYKVAWVTSRTSTWVPTEEAVTGIYGKIDTLVDEQIPAEWINASSEVRDAMGLERKDGKWTIDVVKVGGGQVLPKGYFNALPIEHQTVVLSSGWGAMVSEFYVEVKDGGTGEMMMFPKEDWVSLGGKYQLIIKEDGIDAMRDTFDADNIVSAIGEYMPVSDFNDLKKYDKEYGTNYADIYRKDGYAICVAAIEADRVARDTAIAKLDKPPYHTEEGYNLLLARAGGITSEEMSLAGFDKATVDWVEESYQTSITTGVALPGEKKWIARVDPDAYLADLSINVLDEPKIITESEMEMLMRKWEAKKKAYLGEHDNVDISNFEGLIKLYRAIGSPPNEYLLLAPDVIKRKIIEGAATLFFVPARAALPEVKLMDIAPLQWAIGGAQLAAWAIPFIPKGVLPFVSVGAGSIFGYSTAQNWDQLSTGMKVLAVAGTVLVSLPALMAIGKAAAPVAVKVPIREVIRGEVGGIRLGKVTGEVTIWRGIQVNGKPIFGISRSKPTLGTWGVKRPTFAQIKEGWHPVTKIETTLLGTQKSLKAMGVSDADIAKVTTVWREAVPMFARKPSPAGVTPSEILAGSQRLTPEETAVILKISASAKYADKVDIVYGSASMRPFLQKVLRNWRKWNDLDIQTSMSPKQLVQYVDDIMVELRKIGTKVRLNPENPGVIEKLVKGKWEKITDIHTREILPGATEAWETGAYGYAYAEAPIRIKLPGIGELRLMTISETGLRKAGSITRFQITEIAPFSHRINDIADLYVILLNYNAPKAAAALAKAYGYAGSHLQKLAGQNPDRIMVWGFSPSSVPSSGTPSIAIHIPSIYAAKIPSSLRVELGHYKPITSPDILSYVMQTSPSSVGVVSPSGKVSPSVVAYPVSLTSVSQIIKKEAPSVSKSVAREMSSKVLTSISLLVSGGASSAKISAAISKSLSPYVSSKAISPSASKSISKSISASLSMSPSVSPSPSPSISPSPSPTPSPSPSPSPYPTPSPYPYPHPAPHPIPILDVSGEIKGYKIPVGSITWKQGLFWKYIPPPWRQKKPITLKHPPVGAKFIGAKTPEQTIQMIGKSKAKVPKSASIDLGVVDILIDNYGKKISFTGHGLETVVGSSISGATKGMSIPASGKMKVKRSKRPAHWEKKELVPSASVG